MIKSKGLQALPQQLTLTQDEQELVAAIMFFTTLGPSKYQQTAFSLLNKLENHNGPSFVLKSFNAVNPRIRIVTDQYNWVYDVNSPGHVVEIDVS